MKRIIITGATSMIGIALIHSCLRNGIEKIYAIVRDNCLKINQIPIDERIEIVFCNIDNYCVLTKLIKDNCDVFYHIAWSLTGQGRNSSIEEQVCNIKYTLDAVKVAAELGCKLFVGAGSQAEYGLCNDNAISPNSVANPIQAYGIAKYAAGKLSKQLSERLGMNCVWVRIFSVYGLWEKPSTLIQTCIQNFRNGLVPKFTEGNQLWDYLYSEDAGEAFCKIGLCVRENKVYCLGSGKSKPLREYIETIRDVINPNLTLSFGDIPYRVDSIMNLCADISSLTYDTGWKPQTSFINGISQTYFFTNNVREKYEKN